MLRPTFALLSLVLLAAPASADDARFADVQIASEPLAEGVWMMTGAGGNLLLVAGDGGALMVDDQFAPLTERILTAVGEATPQPLKWVVNTHWHGDHVGGNENLGGAGVVIVAHEGVRARMSTDQVMALWNKEVPAAPPVALPVVTFTETVTLFVGGHEVRVQHVEPAHTDGDSIVFLPGSDVLHMGDVFFNGLYPFIDVGSGGSLDGMIAGAQRGLALAGPATKIVPGHGPLASEADLEAYLAMLIGVRDAVRPLVEAGRTREQVVAAKPTAPFDEVWGGGFMEPDVFTGVVFDGMAAPGE